MSRTVLAVLIVVIVVMIIVVFYLANKSKTTATTSTAALLAAAAAKKQASNNAASGNAASSGSNAASSTPSSNAASSTPGGSAVVDISRNAYGGTRIEDPEGLRGQTMQSCQQRALAKGYVAFDYFNEKYPNPQYRNSCYFYSTIDKTPYRTYAPDHPEYDIMVTGCAKPGALISQGCV